jgi:hypothetical protein
MWRRLRLIVPLIQGRLVCAQVEGEEVKIDLGTVSMRETKQILRGFIQVTMKRGNFIESDAWVE